VDRYPPFRWRPTDYPVTVVVEPGRLNRLAVFFRFLLIIPAAIVVDVLTAGWAVLSFFVWLIVLVLGRTPRPIFGTAAAVLRYVMPHRGVRHAAHVGLPEAHLRRRADSRRGARRPDPALVLSGCARALLIVVIVLGVVSSVTSGFESRNMQNNVETALSGLPRW